MSNYHEGHPGWLQEVVYDAHISTMSKHDLNWHIQVMGGSYTVPIPEQEAEDLFKVLNARYKSWTGKNLKR